MNTYTVYKHTNKENGKVYIGITSMPPEQRWGFKGKGYKGKCPYFWNAIEKYGWDNFLHEILFSNLTKEEACEKEKQLISKFKAQDRDYGYNINETINA